MDSNKYTCFGFEIHEALVGEKLCFYIHVPGKDMVTCHSQPELLETVQRLAEEREKQCSKQ